uniref:MOM1 alpha-helical domain-containing protein n=2 Tax=Cajanus cajan TaxID=3821 RepID=A0A151UFW6_CAJCA
MLAKQHLNFDCKKEVVDEINSRLWGLKEKFLLLAENSNVAGYPKASESPNGIYSYIDVTPEVESVKNDNSKTIKNVQRRKSQWNKLFLMQQEEKQKLKNDIENEITEFRRRYQIEWAAIRSCFPNDVMAKEKLKVFNSEYIKRIKELDRQHEIRLKELEAKQLKTRLIFQESSASDELLHPVASKELGTKVESLQTCGQGQHHNASKALVCDHVAEGKGFNDIIEVMTKTGTGVGYPEAPDTNASVIVPCCNPVESQTPLVKHADVNEMDILASEYRPVSGNKCNNAENEHESQGNIISKHSKSREQCSDGAINMPDKGQGCVNFSRESHDDFGQDGVARVLPSSNKGISDGETLDVPSGEVAPTVCNTSSSNNDHAEIPYSRQGELDGTILSEPGCGPSVEVEANGSNDGAKNIPHLNSRSSEEHIPSVHTMCTPNCENAAQVHEADDNHGSNSAEPLRSAFSDERISPWNSKSPEAHVHNENVMCMLSCGNFAQILEDDGGNGSNNVILNSPLMDERNADGITVLNRDSHVRMLETANCSPSREQISVVAVDVSVLDSVLSRPHGTVNPSNSSDANAILPNQPSLQQQSPDRVSSSIPAGQIPVEVSETSHERATVNVLDGKEVVGIPGTVNCTDYPENVTLSSSSMDQIPNAGPVFDGDLLSGPCTTSPSNGRTLHGNQIPVSVPENSNEEAECQLIDSVVVDKSATSDQQEGVRNTMTENSLSQETPVSRPGDLMEPIEQVQPLSSVESPPDKDTAREMQDSLVSSPVDIVPANQSINDSLVIEPPEQEGQLPSVGFLSYNQDLSNLPLVTETEDQPSNEDDIPNHIPETSIEIQNQAVVQHSSIPAQLEGVCRTVNENSLSQQTPVPRPVDLMEPLEQEQPLLTVVSPPDQNTAREMHHTLVSSPVDIVRANQSINNSLVMEPPDKEGQSNLPLMTGTECQPSNENDLPNHIPETSIEIQNQAVEHRASNLELDSCSGQAVHPASNMDLDSLLPGEVRLQSSDPRKLSTLTEINNHPIQPASQSASRIIPNLCHDPLKNELERLRRLSEQNMRDYENKKSQLKCDFEKELEELCRKYDNKRKEIEVELQKVRKNLDAQFNIVLVNKILAEAFRAKSMDLKVSGASGIQQDASFGQQLFQLVSQQNATRPSLGPSPSCGPPAGSLQSSFATSTSQTMVPPIQGTHNSTPGIFSGVSARLPHINSLSSPLGSVQHVGEIRAPAPHLQPYRPSTSTPAPPPSLCTVPHGRPSQPAPSNAPSTSTPFPHWTPRPMPATFQSVPHRGHWPGSTGGLPTPNLPALNSRSDASSQPGKNLPNVRPHMSNLASLNLSKFGTSSSKPANSAHQSTSHDVVCLSDDE